MEKHTTELKEIILKYSGTIDGAKWILQKFNYNIAQIGNGPVIGRTKKYEVIVGDDTVTYRRLDGQPIEDVKEINYLKRLAGEIHKPKECSVLTEDVNVNEHRRIWS
ncbi:MAG: hypothetical protein KJ697_03150 [Nanoarchaeota archaeon]|nr:hypothetical protein [Nanoarchaeota archaeon]